jgi:hypothetical protein
MGVEYANAHRLGQKSPQKKKRLPADDSIIP